MYNQMLENLLYVDPFHNVLLVVVEAFDIVLDIYKQKKQSSFIVFLKI
jgi:hypothetical protein